MLNQIFPETFSSSSIIDIYHKGEYYKNYILEEQYFPYQYNSWGEKRKYGLLDTKNNVIYPRQSALLEYTNNNGNINKNINFVVDAFTDLKLYQERLFKGNNINNQSIFTKLNVVSSTESVPNLYLKQIERLYEIFINNYLTDNIKKQIVDIFSFTNHLIKFFTLIAPVTPLNRSAFIGSRFAPLSVNGLTISLDSIQLNIDYKIKVDRYINNPEFEHHLVSAARFGFFVDRNFPFNIIADLESPIMKKYASNRGYNTIEEVFDKCYFKAYKADIDSLKNVVLTFWNSFCVLQRSQIINTDKLATNTIYYNQLTMDSFEQQFNINWQLRLYIYTRILEEKISVTQNKFENLYKEAIKINKFSNTEKAIQYISEKISELIAPVDITPSHLTSADLTVKMVTKLVEPLPVEGITF